MSPNFLNPKVLRHMKNCQAFGTLIVPNWPSAVLWPLLIKDTNVFQEFVLDVMKLPKTKESFTPGSTKSVFGSKD